MSSAQYPFYIVKEEIQDSIDKLQSTLHQWEISASHPGEQLLLRKELLAGCESLEWQVDELEKTIGVASRNFLHTESMKWNLKYEADGSALLILSVEKAVLSGEVNGVGIMSANGLRRELMRLPNTHQTDKSNQYTAARDNDDFIQQQDDELDELSASVQRIEGVGLTIHDELLAQKKIIDELGMEMDSTSNRLDFVQKKVATVMKKAGAKGQIMMILFLIALFIILFVLVFFK